jgi:hypothetical protein
MIEFVNYYIWIALIQEINKQDERGGRSKKPLFRLLELYREPYCWKLSF